MELKKKIPIAVFILLLVLYLGAAWYFKSHFYFGTVINGMSAAGMTVEEAEELIAAEAETYSLEVKQRGGITEILDAKQIGIYYISDGSIQAFCEQQSAWKWPLALFQTSVYHLKIRTTYAEDKFVEAIEMLSVFSGEQTVSEDAEIIYDEETKCYMIKPEVYGTEIETERVWEILRRAVVNKDASVSLEDSGCYIDPRYTAEMEELRTALNTVNTYIGAEIVYEFGSETEVVGADRIRDWIFIGDNMAVWLDETQIKNYVNELSKKYNTYGKNRAFTTSRGAQIMVSGGDYGWWMNNPDETKGLIAAIQEGSVGSRSPAYYREAASHGSPDYGNTYVEISIEEQHMWFYKDGVLLVETDVVTGLASDENRKTPTGTYGITYRSSNDILVGEDYNQPVSYWMPFSYNVGIHDAGWRSAFGGMIYLTAGSHGCVNTPPDAAAIIFEHISKGDPVIVY